jgi:hypothetical protein
MSLNNIKLDSFLVAEMYKDVLVENTDLSQQPADSNQGKKQLVEDQKTEKKNWKYLGDNKKKILFIVQYNNAVYIPDDQLNFLTTILSACKLSLADIAILNLATAPSGNYKDIQDKFKSNVTILFGITPQQFEMPIDFPEFQVQPFDKCTFLSAPIIEQLEGDKLLKSKLWVSLRKIFGV